MGIGIVIAYTNIPNPGHGADETMIDIGGIEKTLQQAYDAGDLGGVGLYWESTGITFSTPTKGVFSFENGERAINSLPRFFNFTDFPTTWDTFKRSFISSR